MRRGPGRPVDGSTGRGKRSASGARRLPGQAQGGGPRANSTSLSGRGDNARRRRPGRAFPQGGLQGPQPDPYAAPSLYAPKSRNGRCAMSDDPKHFAELEELLGALREGACSAGQWERLNALLLADPEARQLYLEHSELCTVLHRHQGSLAGAAEPTAVAERSGKPLLPAR